MTFLIISELGECCVSAVLVAATQHLTFVVPNIMNGLNDPDSNRVADMIQIMKLLTLITLSLDIWIKNVVKKSWKCQVLHVKSNDETKHICRVMKHKTLSNISDFDQTWLKEDDNPLEFLGSIMRVEKISESTRIVNFNSIYRVFQKKYSQRFKIWDTQ